VCAWVRVVWCVWYVVGARGVVCVVCVWGEGGGGGVECLGDRTARRTCRSLSALERRMGCVTDSAAAERSDGYRLGSAFFVMTPFLCANSP
jgi:hypothetical protein